MAAAATVSSLGPRYAPEDPTLPKPWRGLVDGRTGYLYFWNPETNVTQYERPVSSGSAPLTRPPVSLSSSIQIYQSTEHYSPSNDAKCVRGGDNTSDIDVPDRYQQCDRNSVECHQDVANNIENSSSAHGGSFRAAGSTDICNDMSAESYRKRHEITISGGDAPPPLISFEATGFPSEILREVHNAGFSAPTPIQAQSWPIVLRGRDIVAIAKTGSGKTLGYLIPGFLHLKRFRSNPQGGPTVLVLSPTRELATQIQDEAVKFGRSSRISCTCVYGGAPKGPQLRDLDRGVDIVVATPGRLNDILEMKRVNLRQVSYLVLDEADRMLDMGFEPQIRKIVKEVPARRQTLMFTATWPKEVRKIAADLLVNPVQVNIGNVDELVANKSITQHVEIIPGLEKHRRLEQILRSQEPGSKIIIFCSTKKMCDQLARNLTRPFGAAAIHGDKSQADRDYVLNQFRTGRSPVLVATDVAARGLDIKDIRVVINYDFPTGIEDYVHRIGRTGRAGATGIAFTFFGDMDAKHASDLIKVLEGADQKVPPQLREMSSYGGGGMGRSRRWGNDGGRGGRGNFDYASRGRDSSRGGFGSGRADNAGSRGYERSYHAADGDRSRARERSHENWGNDRNRSRSRSRSLDRSNKALPLWAGGGSPSRSFHKSMMQQQVGPKHGEDGEMGAGTFHY